MFEAYSAPSPVLGPGHNNLYPSCQSPGLNAGLSCTPSSWVRGTLITLVAQILTIWVLVFMCNFLSRSL